MLRAIGDSKTPLIATAIAAASNIVLDLLFVCVFGWGIAGAAEATLIAQFISRRILLLYNKKAYALTSKKERFALGN